MTKEEIFEQFYNKSYLYKQDAYRLYDVLQTYSEKGNLLEIGTGFFDSTRFFARVKPKWRLELLERMLIVWPK